MEGTLVGGAGDASDNVAISELMALGRDDDGGERGGEWIVEVGDGGDEVGLAIS